MFNKYVTSTTQQWQRNEPWLPATNAPVYQGSTWLKSSLEPLLEQRLCFQHCLVQSWTTCWPSPMQLPLPGCCSSHPGQQLHKAATSNPCSNSATNLIHNGHLCVLCYSMVWFIWVYIYTCFLYTGPPILPRFLNLTKPHVFWHLVLCIHALPENSNP